MITNWKDVTTYSRHDKVRKPTCFIAQSGNLEIVITCNHIDYRGLWIMHCYRLNIDTLLLEGCETMEHAQKAAIAIVKAKALQIYNDANGFAI